MPWQLDALPKAPKRPLEALVSAALVVRALLADSFLLSLFLTVSTQYQVRRSLQPVSLLPSEKPSLTAGICAGNGLSRKCLKR